jgi:hypothetical protein
MHTQPDGKGSGSLLWRFADRASKALARWNEINRLSASEIEEISRDLHLATPEFVSLACRVPSSTALLDRRLAQSGLSAPSLAGRGDVMRDLQRLCGLCTAKSRCAADPGARKRAAYCPNAPTLRALHRERIQKRA